MKDNKENKKRESLKVGLVVPSCRPESFERFMKEWQNLKIHTDDIKLTLYLVEDNKKRTITIPSDVRSEHYSWKEIDAELGEKAWIIPRQTSAIRSFGYYMAWKNGEDSILTLDDDCYPTRDNETIHALITNHLMAFKTKVPYSNYFNVGELFYGQGSGITTRGYPLRYKKPRHAAMSVGGWDNNPDLDALVQIELNNPTIGVNRVYDVVPKNLGVTVCGMNIMFPTELTPLMYFLLQGPKWEIDRWDDIWAGLFAKKVMDELDMPMIISGIASVHHDRASHPLVNLKKESMGYAPNEVLWEYLLKLNLKGNTLKEKYYSLADQLEDKWFHKEGYGENLKTAMKIWVGLFN